MRLLYRARFYRTQLIIIGIVILVVFAVVTAWPRELFYSNQHIYFPHGLYFTGQDFLQNDWYVHTRPAHPVFTVLITAMEQLDILFIGSTVLEIALYLCLLLTLWFLIIKLYDTLVNNTSVFAGIRRREFAFVVLGVYILAQNYLHIWRIEGLAGQYIFRRHLQPSEFVILALLALVLMLYDKWRIAILLLAIVTNLHFGYLVHFSILVMTAAGWLYTQGKWRIALEMILIFGVANLPAFIGGPLAFALEPGSAETQHIIANIRIPHHSLPWFWWNDVQAQKIGLMMLGLLLLFWKIPGVLRWILSVGLGVICTGIIVVWITRNDSLALMHLWRGSVYLYPISQIIILVFAGMYSLKFVSRFFKRIWMVVLVGFYVVLLLAGLVQIQSLIIARAAPPPPPTQMEILASVVQEHTTIHDIILVPSTPPSGWGFQDFRLEAQRPLFVDWKSHPYFPTDLLEWWRRVQVTEEFYAVSHDTRLEICQEEGVDYYILPIENPAPEAALVAATDAYQLVSCTP
ncbi:DUF6798 domain-containing protein [Chloroflexota bacterium]